MSQFSNDPRSNGAKIDALITGRSETGYADLFVRVWAGPSGQTATLRVGRIQYLASGSYEFNIINMSDGGRAGFARMNDSGTDWIIWGEDGYDGSSYLLGYASTLATGIDVLINGEHTALKKGRDVSRVNPGRFLSYTPDDI